MASDLLYLSIYQDLESVSVSVYLPIPVYLFILPYLTLSYLVLSYLVLSGLFYLSTYLSIYLSICIISYHATIVLHDDIAELPGSVDFRGWVGFFELIGLVSNSGLLLRALVEVTVIRKPYCLLYIPSMVA